MTGETNGGEPNGIPSWIKQSLFENVIKENVKDFQSIKQFDVKPGSAAGENYATAIVRIDVEVELQDGSSKSLSFMLKICHDFEIVRKMMEMHDLFSVEKGMYEDIVPAFEKLYADVGASVRIGAASYKLDTPQRYILLENLSPLGFKNTNRLDGLDMQHIESVLKKLAQWHAASAVYATNVGPYEDKYLYGYLREEAKPIMKTMQENIHGIFKDCVRNYSNYELYANEFESIFDNYIEKLFQSTKCDPNEFNVLNHGDCWSNNVMFQYDAFGKIKETYLIDYQMPKYGSPAIDLFYFLLSSAKYELKLSKFDYFIKFYHDNLYENLKLLKYSKKIPTLRDIHTMLYKHGIFAFSAAAGVMGPVLLDPTENANMENFADETGAGDDFKKQMYSNARYRKHMEAILPWLQNRGALTF